MIKSLVWNIRGIGKMETRHHLRNLCRSHNVSLLAILELTISSDKISIVQHQLRFSKECFNITNKIWVFWHDCLNINIIANLDQVIHMKVSLFDKDVICSFIYAGSFRARRYNLWDSLKNIANTINFP